MERSIDEKGEGAKTERTNLTQEETQNKKSAYVASFRRHAVLRRLRGHAKPGDGGDGHGDKKGKGEGEGKGIIHQNYLTEEEKQKKCVYIVLTPYRDPANCQVLRINPHAADGGFLEDISPLLAKNPPSDFNLIYRFSVAALHHKLYFIGGCYKNTGYLHFQVVSRQVFAFNTHTNEWDASPTQLNHGRLCSTVLTYKNKIYAFGYIPFRVFQREQFLNQEEPLQQPDDDDDDESFGSLDPSEHPDGVSCPKWVEVFDPNTLQWEFVRSNGKIPAPLVRQSSPVTPAVHGDSAFFCLQAHTLYVYHFPTSVWTTLSTYPRDTLHGPALYWSSAVVIFRSFLFFHHYGTIYAMKAGNGLKPSDLLTIRDAKRAFGTPTFSMFLPRIPSSSYLVNAGNGVMCLVYKSPSSRELKFHKIELQVSSSDEIPSLHNPKYSATYSPNGHFNVSMVLAM